MQPQRVPSMGAVRCVGGGKPRPSIIFSGAPLWHRARNGGRLLGHEGGAHRDGRARLAGDDEAILERQAGREAGDVDVRDERRSRSVGRGELERRRREAVRGRGDRRWGEEDCPDRKLGRRGT